MLALVVAANTHAIDLVWTPVYDAVALSGGSTDPFV